jgi:hypothetical protein
LWPLALEVELENVAIIIVADGYDMYLQDARVFVYKRGEV